MNEDEVKKFISGIESLDELEELALPEKGPGPSEIERMLIDALAPMLKEGVPAEAVAYGVAGFIYKLGIGMARFTDDGIHSLDAFAAVVQSALIHAAAYYQGGHD